MRDREIAENENQTTRENNTQKGVDKITFVAKVVNTEIRTIFVFMFFLLIFPNIKGAKKYFAILFCGNE